MSKTPHDKLFKKIFGQPQRAAGQLRAVLDRSLSTSIDWDTLKVEAGSYVDAVLADRYSDLLFSALAGPERVLLYVLFEHQSTPEPRMALRLLDYMVQIWRRFAQEKVHVGQPLPLIVPVVLSHVPGGWTPATRFADLFAPGAVSLGSDAVPDFRYAVDDLAKLSDAALRSREVDDAVKLALWLLRDARDGEVFLREALSWARMLEAVSSNPATRSLAITLLTYLVYVLEEENLRRFRVIIHEQAPATEALTMTAAESLIMRGKAQGKAEGVAAGKAEGKADDILLVLRTRGLAVPEEVRARVLACSDLDTLSTWLERAVTAASIDAVFADE